MDPDPSAWHLGDAYLTSSVLVHVVVCNPAGHPQQPEQLAPEQLTPARVPSEQLTPA